MGHFLLPINFTDLIESIDGRRETSVHAEDAVLDQCTEAEIVEHFGAVSPHIDTAILPQTLIVESVHLGNLSGLVIASNECDAIRISNLCRKYVNACLYHFASLSCVEKPHPSITFRASSKRKVCTL